MKYSCLNWLVRGATFSYTIVMNINLALASVFYRLRFVHEKSIVLLSVSVFYKYGHKNFSCLMYGQHINHLKLSI